MRLDDQLKTRFTDFIFVCCCELKWDHMCIDNTVLIFFVFCCSFEYLSATTCVFGLAAETFVCVLCCTFKCKHMCVLPSGTFVRHLSLPCVTHCLGIGSFPLECSGSSIYTELHFEHTQRHHDTALNVFQIALNWLKCSVKCGAAVRHCYGLLACSASGFWQNLPKKRI